MRIFFASALRARVDIVSADTVDALAAEALGEVISGLAKTNESQVLHVLAAPERIQGYRENGRDYFPPAMRARLNSLELSLRPGLLDHAEVHFEPDALVLNEKVYRRAA